MPGKSTADFVKSLEPPRRMLIMVKAGAPTDAVIDELVPLLDKGDIIIIDGGNAHQATVPADRAGKRRPGTGGDGDSPPASIPR